MKINMKSTITISPVYFVLVSLRQDPLGGLHCRTDVAVVLQLHETGVVADASQAQGLDARPVDTLLLGIEN